MQLVKGASVRLSVGLIHRKVERIPCVLAKGIAAKKDDTEISVPHY